MLQSYFLISSSLSGEAARPNWGSSTRFQSYRAHVFAEVVDGIERALANPTELAGERARVTRAVLGDVDGHAADRVAEAVLSAVSD